MVSLEIDMVLEDGADIRNLKVMENCLGLGYNQADEG
jgi:hypothetical protein